MYIEFILCYSLLSPVYIFVANKLRLNIVNSIILLIYRGIFSILYIYYANNNPADANMYINVEDITSSNKLSFGSDAVLQFNLLISKLFFIPNFGLYGVYGIIGAIGMLFLYKTLKSKTENTNKRIISLTKTIVYLPSLAFWTLAPGKDPIFFLLINIIIYKYAKNQKKERLINNSSIVNLFVLFLIRPHVALSMTLGFLINFFVKIKKRKGLLIRIFSIAIIFFAIVKLLPFMFGYAGLESYSVDMAVSVLEDRFSSNSETLNYPYIIRFLSYLFSPLPSTNINLFYLLEITQTTFLVFYFIKLIQFYKPKLDLITHPLFSYSIILTALLSLITFNVGISSRQRWLIIPAIIISIMTTNRKPSKEIID
tara:strand:- start:31815 stop:32921 length:1107 start_codon:yes stop_codon:yes gene_type:complete